MRSVFRQRLGPGLERAIGSFQPERHLRFHRARIALERAAAGPVSVLDAGCGEGLLAVELARRHPDWMVVGVDINDEMLRRANERAEQAHLDNVAFERKDVTMSSGSGSYDAVLAIQLLEEIDDDDAALRSLAEALRPGGIFLADVPERSWTPILPGSESTWRFEVRHGYEAEELAERLSRFGLSVQRNMPSSRGTIRLAQELRDRMKKKSIRVRAFLYPWLAAAVSLERLGLTWGQPRSLFIEARRQRPRDFS